MLFDLRKLGSMGYVQYFVVIFCLMYNLAGGNMIRYQVSGIRYQDVSPFHAGLTR
jgi:hypothetical protein